MPIYAYRCTECGFSHDVLQKISDPVLTVCPSCGKEALKKQVTAAGFQLKGSGWYATDFKGSTTKEPTTASTLAASNEASKTDSPSTLPNASESPPAAKSTAKSDTVSPSSPTK